MAGVPVFRHIEHGMTFRFPDTPENRAMASRIEMWAKHQKERMEHIYTRAILDIKKRPRKRKPL